MMRLAASTLIGFSIFLFSILANAQDTPRFGFSVITTGYSAGTLEAMVVADGSWFEVRNLVHPAVLVEHPQGTLLWDTGLGTEVDAQLDSFSWLDQMLFSVTDHNPAIEQLQEHGYPYQKITAVIPSHMHWDHVSGLEDFSPIPVWVQDRSLEEANAGEPPGFVYSQFDDPAINWQSLSLDERMYEGFALSLDVFGDGRVVLVDTSGHSHGHLGMFLNLSDQERYFFIGDTTWVIEGVEQNRSRPWIAKAIIGVDVDYEQNAEVVAHIYNLSKEHPELTIVPAHDERVAAKLPALPTFRYSN